MTIFSSVITPVQKLRAMSTMNSKSEKQVKESQPGFMSSLKKLTATGRRTVLMDSIRSISMSHRILCTACLRRERVTG